MIIENVITILKEKGNYKRVSNKADYKEANVSFSFDSVLQGPGEDNNLIIIENKDKIDFGLYNKLRQFSFLLSKIKSQRSLSIILITNYVSVEVLHRLQELGRIVVIDASISDEELEPHVLSLLPLDLPEQQKVFQIAEKLLKKECETLIKLNLDMYIKAAKIGPDEVEKLINKQIDSILNANGQVL